MLLEEIKTGYTRVTDILKPFSKLDDIPPTILEMASARGEFIHSAICGVLDGVGYPEIPEKWKGYIESFEIWAEVNPGLLEAFTPQAYERRFYDDKLMITGQCDLIIDNVLIDFKTSSSPSRTWPLQLSAYAKMARDEGFTINGICIVHLNKEGKEPKIYRYEEQWDLFKKCYDCYVALIK